MDFDRLRELIEHGIPFNAVLGISAEELSPGRVRLRVPYRPELLGDTRRLALHGGVISTLVDVTGGFAVWSMCRLEDRIATIDLGVDYLRPAQGCDLMAEATVRLLGNRVGNAEVKVWCDGEPDKLVAAGRAVYNIRRGK